MYAGIGEMHDLKGFDNMIAIIDYNAGNLKSVEKALSAIGRESVITRDRHEILKADKVIHEVADMDKPFLGICLGLQLLFEGSDESQGVEGLHVLDGQILKIPDKEGLKIPHIGWNSLELQNNGRLFEKLPENPYVYFVHSYYLKAADESIVKATTEYSAHIHASVEKGNVFACQFHPEKSSSIGLSILKNFAQIGEA